MNTLYDIRCKFAELMNNDELTEEQVQELGTELAGELQNKSSNIVGYIINSESLLEDIKVEEERLANLRKTGENKLAKFKEYVKGNMEALGLTKIQTKLGTLSVNKNPISIEVIDDEKIPSEFKKEKITISVDKTAIKNHFTTTGELVEGVKIIDNKTSLRVR